MIRLVIIILGGMMGEQDVEVPLESKVEATNTKRRFPFSKKKILVAVLVVLAFVFLVALIFGAVNYLKFDKNVVAIVGSKSITKKDLNDKLFGVHLSEPSDEGDENVVSAEDKKSILDLMIEDEVIDKRLKSEELQFPIKRPSKGPKKILNNTTCSLLNKRKEPTWPPVTAPEEIS